jgi:uncharacterized protein
VILVDANVLVYAYVTDYEQHPDARAWLDDQLSGDRRVGLAWSTLLAFVRLVTNPRLYPEPLEHGLTLATSDAGFARFDGLRCIDPLR